MSTFYFSTSCSIIVEKGGFAMQTTDKLMEYIQDSPSPYHAAAAAAARLEAAGFTRLEESAPWALSSGQCCYTTRNQSSLIAFRLPGGTPEGWRMTAAHSDSPTFYVKNDALEGDKRYVRLAVEGYGGMNCASWLDRPLTVAGRAVVRTPAGVEGRLVYLDRDLLTIPSLAIHQQRDVNRGHDYNAQKDMQPLYALGGGPSLTALLAEELGVDVGDILATDLVLCPRQAPVRIGPEGEFFQAPRIDDLGCAYATLEGFLSAKGTERFGQLYCLFDNEEVGLSLIHILTQQVDNVNLLFFHLLLYNSGKRRLCHADNRQADGIYSGQPQPLSRGGRCSRPVGGGGLYPPGGERPLGALLRPVLLHHPQPEQPDRLPPARRHPGGLAHDRRPQRLAHLLCEKRRAGGGQALRPPGGGGIRRHELRQLAGPAPHRGGPGGGAHPGRGGGASGLSGPGSACLLYTSRCV